MLLTLPLMLKCISFDSTGSISLQMIPLHDNGWSLERAFSVRLQLQLTPLFNSMIVNSGGIPILPG